MKLTRKNLIKGPLMVLTVLFVSCIALGLCMACAAKPGDLGLVDGHLQPCPSSPNCVSSDRTTETIEPLAYEGSGDEAFQSLIQFLTAEPRTEVVSVEGGYAHVVFRTALFGFPDDLELRLDEGRGSHSHPVGLAPRLLRPRNERRRIESIRARWRAGRS